MEGGHSKPHQGLCWAVARAWEGLGTAGPGRGSPAGNLQHLGCFVIPWSLRHPPPWVSLPAADGGAEPHPSCDRGKGTWGWPLGQCHSLSLIPQTPSKGWEQPEGPQGPVGHHGCGGWGALPPGMAPNLGVMRAVTSLLQGHPCLAEVSVTPGEFGTPGMGEGAEPRVGGWRQLGSQVGAVLLKAFPFAFEGLCLSRPFPLLSKAFQVKSAARSSLH